LTPSAPPTDVVTQEDKIIMSAPEGGATPITNIPVTTSSEGVSSHDNTSSTSTQITSPWEAVRVTPTPTAIVPDSPASPDVRRSSRRNKGQHSEQLMESSNTASYLSSYNITLPNLSLHGSSQTTYTSGNNNNRLPRIPTERLNASYISGLKWNRLLTVCHTNLSTLGSFIVEHQQYLTTLLSGMQLVDYLNLALYMTVANQDDNPTLTEAMNGPDAAGFFKAMEQELETLIQMEVFTVLD
jgi:hypothetical protein